MIVEAFSALGGAYIKIFKWIFKHTFYLVYLFFKWTVKKTAAFFVFIGKGMGGFFKKVFFEIKRFFSEIRLSAKENSDKHFNERVKLFFLSIKEAFHPHPGFRVRFWVNTFMPVCAFAVMILFFAALSNLTLGLKVTLNGRDVGTVSNENDFKQARISALSRLPEDADVSDGSTKYSFSLVTRDKITDSETLTQNILSAYSDKTVNACGVYINDEFLCSLDSSDTFSRVAREVLNDNIKKYNYDTTNTEVSFSDDVKYITGLYPNDDTRWSAEKFKKYLESDKSEEKKYTAADGDNLETISKKTGISQKVIKNLNSSVDFDNLKAGTVLTIKNAEPNVSVKAVKTYVSSVKIPFETIRQSDSSLDIGTVRTIVTGSEGQDLVSYTDTYIDGVQVSSKKEIVRLNVKNAVNGLVRIGTNSKNISTSGSTSGTAGTVYRTVATYGFSSVISSASPRLYKSQGGSFIWPAPDNCYRLSRGFSSSHKGIDIISSNGGSCAGRPIVAVADGVVVTVTKHWSWGNYVQVDHGDGVVTGYAHALDGSFKVNVGDYVRAGQQLSSIGTTGNSTGYHLHFEVWIDGERVDPMPYLQ